MKVYIVTTGSYSSYSISHVFKHQADAEAYAATFSPSTEAEVEEYELWEGPVKKRVHWYLQWNTKEFVFYRGRDGRMMTRSVEPEPHTRSYDEDDLGEQIKISVSWKHEGSFGGRDVLTINGPSEEAVLKVFREQRAQWLARKEGIS